MPDEQEIRAWLKTVPFNLLAEAYNQRVAARRKRHSTGRPKLIRTCKCGFSGGAREMRAHKCTDTGNITNKK